MRVKKFTKVVAIYCLIQFTVQTFLPTIGYALTSGPTQPEFSSFEPVASTNMVDLFSGDFTYNLPILEVPGPQGSSYPLSLSYHSGATPEEEASWVGYGWTLNAGAINRATRGIPDDYNGKDITFHNKMPKNWTVTAGGSAGIELGGFDLPVNGQVSIRYNNYRGFGYNTGIGISLGKGLLSLGYGVDNGEGNFSLNVNPAAILNYSIRDDEFQRHNVNIRYLKAFMDGRTSKIIKKSNTSTNLFGSSYGVFSYNLSSKPNMISKYEGESFTVSVGFEGNGFFLPIGGTGNVWGTYSYQQNQSSETVSAYGYMYDANSNAESVRDYHVEKEQDFNKRDKFLGIPFNDADNFLVTGEGIGGGFRIYNSSIGHFAPRSFESELSIYNVGAEAAAPVTFGPGFDVGVGSNSFAVGEWDGTLSSFENFRSPDADEPVLFRFNNDLAGEWGENHNDRPLRANVGKTFSLPSSLFSGEKIPANNNTRTGRSSFISFHTNSEIASRPDLAFTKTSPVNTLAERSNSLYADLIGEISIVNEAGARYLYGLPVYNRNEKTLSFGVGRLSSNDVDHNFLVYKKDEDTKIGQEQNEPYASTYLLTEIVGTDYIDRGSDGPTNDDFGGYTRFNYQRKSTSDWYKWRAPYRGLNYEKNSHSDPKDDLGSYSEGERQIYYLHSIETKTHVAFFVLADGDRFDALEAPEEANALLSDGLPGNTALHRLEKIELYSLDDCQKVNNVIQRDIQGSPILKTDGSPNPVKTVVFNYDYSLCKNLPNSAGTGDASGKLTLKSLYFEYYGIHQVRVSPYQFGYEYPSTPQYPAKYLSGADEVISGFAITNQNPSYDKFNLDAWGNYQINGIELFGRMQPWIDQTVDGNIDFDPAVWQLKVIKLPSGGEIHVQYEQDDYNYVQDQEAHVMANVVNAATTVPTDLYNQFVINPASINVNSQEEIDQLVEMIKSRYVNSKRKIYFRFLFRLLGEGTPSLASCNADFITGYASVLSCVREGQLIRIELAPGNFPQQACKDFVKAERLGKLDPDGKCDPAIGVSDSNNPASVVKQLLSMAGGIVNPENICKDMSFANSYLRVPTPLPKKGGGLRVKRLLMFDRGIEQDSPVLYGSEYIYEKLEDGRRISSGVATNEPGTIREENILVDYIPRKDKNSLQELIAGKNKKQSEGPIGESMLPGASVGYSRVVVKNIHSGKTAPGFSVNEFFTARDFPAVLPHPDTPESMTDLKSETPVREYRPIPYMSIVKNKTVAAQGFSIVLNSMHGQAKQMSVHAGVYSPTHQGSPIAYTAYEYFKPGEKVPMMSGTFDGITLQSPGREVDITLATRSVKESMHDINVEADLQMTVIPFLVPVFLFFPMATPSFASVEGELSTHATTKVVRYPAILKKTTTSQDGIVHVEENVAFDQWTGKPVAVKSFDEFEHTYLVQNIPASWEYKAMAGKWMNEGKYVRPSTGSFQFDGQYLALSEGCNLATFTKGDKVELGAGSGALYYVSELDAINNRLRLIKAGTVDASSNPDVVTVVQSGNTNQLTAQAGNITYFSENNSLSLPVLDKVGRYESKDANTFLQELNTKINALVINSGNMFMTGTYTGLDMTAFAGMLPDCSIDLRNVTVRQLEYRFTKNDTSITLELMSFDIKCGDDADPDNGWVTITSDGWVY